MGSPTIDKDGNFFYDDGEDWQPYVWKKGEPDMFGQVHDRDAPDHSRMIAELLLNEVLFPNSRKFIWEGWNGDEQNIQSETLVLFVNCNDIFEWGCADAEHVTMSELPSLYDMWLADKVWGSAIWCMFKRNRRPQPPVERDMKTAGSWNEKLEALTR